MTKLIGVLFAVLAAASLAMAQEMVRDWVYFENMDPFTDANTSFIAAPASEYPQYASSAALVIRCTSGSRIGVEMYFLAAQYLGSDDFFDIIYRIDTRDPVQGQWYVSTDGEAVFAPDDGAVRLIRSLQAAKSLAFRIYTDLGNETYTVPIGGLGEAMSRLACFIDPLD